MMILVIFQIPNDNIGYRDMTENCPKKPHMSQGTVNKIKKQIFDSGW